MDMERDRKSLTALMIGLMLVSSAVYILVIVLVAQKKIPDINFSSASPYLFSIMPLLLAGWILAVGVYRDWQWAPRTVTLVALVVMGLGLNWMVKVLSLNFGKPLNPFTIVTLTSGLIFILPLIIWAAAALYFSLAVLPSPGPETPAPESHPSAR